MKMYGMSIAGRAERLSLAVGKLYGVNQVDVNYILDNMSVKYDSKKVTIGQIRQTIDGENAHLDSSS